MDTSSDPTILRPQFSTQRITAVNYKGPEGLQNFPDQILDTENNRTKNRSASGRPATASGRPNTASKVLTPTLPRSQDVRVRYVKWLSDECEQLADQRASVRPEDWTRVTKRAWDELSTDFDMDYRDDIANYVVLAAWRVQRAVPQNQRTVLTDEEVAQASLQLEIEDTLTSQAGLRALASWDRLAHLASIGQPPTAPMIAEMEMSLAVWAFELLQEMSPIPAWRRAVTAFGFSTAEWQEIVRLAAEIEQADPISRASSDPEMFRSYLTRRTMRIADNATRTGANGEALRALKFAGQLHGLTRTRGDDQIQKLLDGLYDGDAKVVEVGPLEIHRGGASLPALSSPEGGSDRGDAGDERAETPPNRHKVR